MPWSQQDSLLREFVRVLTVHVEICKHCCLEGLQDMPLACCGQKIPPTLHDCINTVHAGSRSKPGG